MMRYLAALVSLLLVGCVSTANVESDFSSRWTGKPLDAFVVKHGIPQASQKLNDGRTVVEWTNVHGIADTGAPLQTLVATGAPVQGGSYQLTCKLRIVAAPTGVIESIAIASDTIGRWTTSRCAEVLK